MNIILSFKKKKKYSFLSLISNIFLKYENISKKNIKTTINKPNQYNLNLKILFFSIFESNFTRKYQNFQIKNQNLYFS